MSAEEDALIAELAQLREARAAGVRRVRTKQNGVEKESEFATGAELQAAIADAERRLAALRSGPVHTVRIVATKGF